MKHALVFYMASLFIFFTTIKNKKISVILASILYVLAVIDLLSWKLAGTHINFFVLARMDLSMLEMAIEVVPRYVYGLIVASIIVFFVHLFLYRHFRVDFYNNKKIAIVLVIIGLFGFYKSKTTKAYIELTQQFNKIYQYSILDVDEVLHSLDANVRYLKASEVKAESGKNVVIIYCESFERNFLDTSLFKNETTSMKSLINDGWVSYNNYQCFPGSGWTIGALYATQTGFPTFFPQNGNKIFQSVSASNITSLGTVLKSAGYENIFLSNSKLSFAGTGNMMKKLGYEIIGAEKFDKDIKRTGWGVHDYDLFEEAKKEYCRLNSESKPFNLTLLTVDTHFPKGIIDRRMEKYLGKVEDYGNHRFSVATLDFLLGDFIRFIKSQPNGERTIVVVLSDHLMMGDRQTTPLVADLSKQPRRNLLITSKKIVGVSQNDMIAFYDFPNIVLDLVGVEHNAKIGKKLLPHLSKKFIQENAELFQTLNLKLNKS